MKPRLLDLFCGAGGAAMGYHQAGFEVVGVDHVPQPHYPFEFVQRDAIGALESRSFTAGFSAIHASPPCQHYAPVTRWRGSAANHPDLLRPVINWLQWGSVPWVVENVPHSPMAPDFVLCGSMFDIPVRRHRWFCTSWPAYELVQSCQHRNLLPFMHKGERAYADAMGCDWMTAVEARQAVPPVYTQYIGTRLLDHLRAVA